MGCPFLRKLFYGRFGAVHNGREVWLLAPGNQRQRTEAFRKYVGGLCQARGWRFEYRPTYVANTPHGRVRMLDAAAANELYRRVHRAVVGVLTVEDASVTLDPRDPAAGRGRLTVSNLLRYKAFFLGRLALERVADFRGNLSHGELLQFDAFGQWGGLADDEGQDDPRYLPMHVFVPGEVWDRLDTQGGRQSFRREFRNEPWIDRRRMTWTRTDVLHTRDVLAIAGRLLPAGFHWDTSLERRGPVQLISHAEVWRVDRGGHLNVHPDAYFRQGRRSVRVWPRR